MKTIQKVINGFENGYPPDSDEVAMIARRLRAGFEIVRPNDRLKLGPQGSLELAVKLIAALNGVEIK